MQTFYSQNLKNNIQHTLQQANYQPFIAKPCRHCANYLNYQWGVWCGQATDITTISKQDTKRLGKAGQRLLQAMAILAVVLPTKSLTNVQPLNVMEKIAITKTLTVATTPEHLFYHDGHIHGFGYDVVNRYANHIGANLTIKTYPDSQQALQAVKMGGADVLLGSGASNIASIADIGIHCHDGQIQNNGTNQVTLSTNQNLANNIKNYLCTPDTINDTQKMAQFYRANVLNDYSLRHFKRAINERLPNYQYAFKRQASIYQHDWQLLVAISYQESHLEPTATSRTGVQGIMMLTNDTATEMGITDRTDAVQSIQGGAKYLSKLKTRFADIPESERLWFVLAAYNMGPNAVRNIQGQIAKAGDDPKLWSNFYTYLATHADNNGRYVQCMHYVTNIRAYFELLKTNPSLIA